MKMPISFTQHPASVGETYLQHLMAASRFGMRMLLAGLACLVHGLLPFLFVRTGSNCIVELHDQMARRRPAQQSRFVVHEGRALNRAGEP